jgi:hypothetical protein
VSLLDRLLSSFSRHGGLAPGSERVLGQSLGDREHPTLERLLATLEVEVKSFAICEVTPGDVLLLEGMQRPLFHYVLKGSGILRVEAPAN